MKFHVEMDIETDEDDGPTEPEVLETDLRDIVQGDFINYQNGAAPQYVISVQRIEVTEA